MKKACFLVLLLAGCATQPRLEWRHPQHGDHAQFRNDVNQCEYEAVKASGSYAPNNRGYRTSLGQSLADQMDVSSRKDEISIACMKARGYALLPVK